MIANDLLPQAALEEEFDPVLECTLELEQTARVLDLEPWIVQRLRHPERETTVNLVLVRDNGQPAVFTAFRVQHSSVRGPMLGGLRLAPDLQLTHVRARAMHTAWQCALLDVPFGGSAGAIVCDPEKLSERELRHLSADYVEALRGLLGPGSDILTEDAGSNSLLLSWMLNAHARLAGRLEPGTVTGKPSVLFGLPDHADATASGLLEVLSLALAEAGRAPRGLRVALQGFGQTGAAIARLLSEAGAAIVAVADISGGLHRTDGISVPALLEWTEKNSLLFGFPYAEVATNPDVLQADCDVLILAAAPGQITVRNAGSIRAPLVIEAMRGAITTAAHERLRERNLVVIPSLLAGAGAVAAAYLEWSRNLGHEGFLLDGVEERIRLQMRMAYREVAGAAKRYQSSLREGAMLVALERIAAALRLR